MSKQIIIVGLGQFGMGLARALSQYDAEIIAVDADQRRVDLASSWVAKSICFDATDEDLISQLQPDKRDVCICATGDQSKEVGIICTALFKQFGAKRIIARSNDDLHARILRLVGANEVVNPEWDFGERFAPHILNEHVLNEMLLGTDLTISEVRAPELMWGKSLGELNLSRAYGITVIAIRVEQSGKVKQAESTDRLQKGDIILISSKKGTLEKLMENVNS